MPGRPGVASADRGALLQEAWRRRETWLAEWHSEGTDCYRLFHGAGEGWPGVALDRYGPLLLLQSFRDPLSEAEIAQFQDFYAALVPAELVVFERDAGGESAPVVARELGLGYHIRARHRGRDPHLFLDFRVARRWLRKHSQGRRMLNLFAYTGGAGLCAAAGGATEVLQVDFSPGNLELARANAELNALSVEHLCEDAFPVLWQLSGMGVKGKAARRRYHHLEPRTYDLVVLDPPAYARGPFGAVDLVHDYPSLLKPALRLLAPTGVLLATCNVGAVSEDTFRQQLLNSARKVGRSVELERLVPEADFPSPDGQPPLKILLARC